MSTLGSHKPEHARYISRRQISALLYEARLAGHAKAYLMFFTQYLLGLRIGEVIRLRYDHLGPMVRGRPTFVKIPTLKKRKGNWRGVPVDKNCIGPGGDPLPLFPVPVLSHPEIILAAFNREYRQTPAEKKSEWLFPGRSPRKHLSRVQAINLFHRFKGDAHLPDYFSPHALRHAAATHLYEKSSKVSVCTQFLRHSAGGGRSVGSGESAQTAGYVHVTEEQWRTYWGALDIPQPLRPLPR